MRYFLFIFFMLFFSGCEVDEVIDKEEKFIIYINNLNIDDRMKDILLKIVYSGTHFILDPNNQTLVTELTDKSFEFQDKIIKIVEEKESPGIIFSELKGRIQKKNL